MKLIPVLGKTAFFLSVGIIFFLPPLDTDLGWLLRYGEHFWRTGQILQTNTFTVFNAGYLWPNSYILYEILIYPIYKTLGPGGLSLLSSITYLSIFYLTYLLTQRNLKLLLISFPLIIYLSSVVFFFGLRAQIFSLLFSLILVWLLTQRAGKHLIFIPILFLLWVNTHGGFVLGLIILCLWFVSSFFVSHRGSLKHKTVGIFILGLSLSACLLNPYGARIFNEELRHFVTPLHTLIAEWVPPDWPTKIFISIIFIINAIFFVKLVRRKKVSHQSIFYFLLMILFYALSLMARRNLPYFVLFSVISLGELCPNFRKTGDFLSSRRLTILSVIYLVVASVFILPNTIKINSDRHNYCQAAPIPYPCQAVEFMRKQKPGNVYNTYEWGGYLEWELPQFKYFVDGRMPAWPTKDNKSPYTVFLEIIQARPGWEAILNKYKIQYLFIVPGTYLDLELSKGNLHWREIYRDGESVIYSRREEIYYGR